MKRAVVVIALCLLAAATSFVDSPRADTTTELLTIFQEGNALYEQGDYAGAIEKYQLLNHGGVDAAALYYNLGNAFYKSNDLGRAVLFYERSLRLNPRSRDVKENLDLVRTQLKDKQFVKKQNRFVKGIIVLHDNSSTSEMFVFTSAAYLVLCLVLIIFIFRETAVVSAIHSKISIVSPGRLLGLTFTQELLVVMGLAFVLFVSGGISTYNKVERERNRRDAVVLAEEIPVFSSPTENATLQFRIHRGTMVTVREVRHDWARIQLPGGLSGWLAMAAIERV